MRLPKETQIACNVKYSICIYITNFIGYNSLLKIILLNMQYICYYNNHIMLTCVFAQFSKWDGYPGTELTTTMFFGEK